MRFANIRAVLKQVVEDPKTVDQAVKMSRRVEAFARIKAEGFQSKDLERSSKEH